MTSGTKCRSYNVDSLKASGRKLIQTLASWIRHCNWGSCQPYIYFGWQNILPETMACSAVRSDQGLSYHFTVLAREFRYLARWNTHRTPSVIPFIQINCVRLNPAMYFPANQSPGLWTLANNSLTLAKSHVVPRQGKEVFARKRQFPPYSRPTGDCS